MAEEKKVIAKAEKPAEKVLRLNEQEVNKILSYLAEKPFKEVFEFVNMIQSKWIQQNGKGE